MTTSAPKKVVSTLTHVPMNSGWSKGAVFRQPIAMNNIIVVNRKAQTLDINKKLHVPPVLSTHFKQRLGDLTERTILHRFHQFLKQIPVSQRDFLQLFQRLGGIVLICFLK